jgi:phosphoribosylformylglycinamidine (FGAM) synthase PurS component
MPNTIEMVVGLKVPDNTAITALQTLKKIGFSRINDVRREDYYKFIVEGDDKKFKDKICKVDIMVNANKHYFDFSIKRDNVKVLVKNINDDGSGIASTLKNRLGFREIKKAEKGTLWSLSIDADKKESVKIAEKAARELLTNENYQEFEIINQNSDTFK